MATGEVRQTRCLLAPQVGAVGRVLRIHATVLDVTHEQTRRELESNLGTTQTAIEQFVSLAAPDLRTPMYNVHMLAGMLREDRPDPGDGKPELIDLLDDPAGTARQMIDDGLNRARAVDARPEIATFELEDLVRDLLVLLDPLRVHRVRCDRACVTCDRMAFQITLRNPIDNAFKHSASAGVSVWIRIGQPSPDIVEVSVADDGPGLEPSQCDALNNGVPRSGGQGLNAVQRMLWARRGSLSVRRQPEDRGTRFMFSLPGAVIGHNEADHPGRCAWPGLSAAHTRGPARPHAAQARSAKGVRSAAAGSPRRP